MYLFKRLVEIANIEIKSIGLTKVENRNPIKPNFFKLPLLTNNITQKVVKATMYPRTYEPGVKKFSLLIIFGKTRINIKPVIPA